MSEQAITINVARDFSRYPGGRYLADGEFSGQRFRDDVLVPALRASMHVTVEMDGTLGYGSSFLEEAFGGLVRVSGFDANDLGRQLSLKTTNEVLERAVTGYISAAELHKGARR